MEPSQVANSWDAYWQGTGETGAYSSGGVNHPAIEAFWTGLFSNLQNEQSAPALLDIASGNGAVIECALDAFAGHPIDISCVDVSPAAIANINSRFPSVKGLVSDACSISLEDAGFDLVTSQFGVEYAGREAIPEAARLLRAGGHLALLMHSESGAIHQECSDNLNAITRFRDSDFIVNASKMFKAGFEAVRGADRTPYDEAASQLAPAVAEAEAIMREFGEGVADDTVARLYSDVGRIHGEIQHYEPDEVLGWLERMEAEMNTYVGRMSSMVEAALDEAGFEAICEELAALGCEINRAGPLLAAGNDIPLAWVIVAQKTA